MRKNSIKNTRINGEVLKELSQIIRSEVKDPRIHPMTSVMRVQVAPDLKSAKAFISVLGGEPERKATLEGLKAAEGYIRRQLAHNLNLRNTPEILFIADDSIEYGVEMSRRIDEVIRSDQESEKLREEMGLSFDTEETEKESETDEDSEAEEESETAEEAGDA